ncbi:HAMP domain-containing histidine kinase [Neobacillus mesonae]|nr:HAMP domain-containing histidine kinase [Neobacillus mesonae]
MSWDMLWLNNNENVEINELMQGEYRWTRVQASQPREDQEHTSAQTAWTRVEIPENVTARTGLLFEYIHGQEVDIYIDGDRVFNITRDYPFDRNLVLLSLNAEDSGKDVYIWTHSVNKNVGIDQSVLLGPYYELNAKYVREGFSNLIIGGILISLSVIIALTCLLIGLVNRKLWMSLTAVMVCLGIIIMMYSTSLYTLYPEQGALFQLSLELGMLLLLPLLSYSFEQMLGPGPGQIIRKLWIFMLIYVLICVLVRLTNDYISNEIYPFYEFVTRPVFGVIFVVQLIMLTYFAVLEARHANRKAVILSCGLGIFALTAIVEWILYYTLAWYEFWLVKWGMIAFIISLIIVKIKPVWGKHDQVELYTKELEVFNNELQRSEKIKIISELAASVAHEVRNPLQVTRGFLQLMGKQENFTNRKYVGIALEELDRASEIINDFLTFAKPEFDHIRLINLAEEFNHIEGVLVPMANLEGGVLTMDVPENLWVRGNTSKFKQAFINILKNSIEALQGSGEVKVKAYARGKEIFIHVQDNGVGMDEQELMRLGEPYFSNKTKGTGLGMMVTFRIIEAMDGSIEYSSEKGVGTEAVVRFPSGT